MSLVFNPPITHFIIFSGGGGLIEREAKILLQEGVNKLQLRGIPASFDQDSFWVDLEGTVVLKQLSIRKPNRRYVEDILQKEGDAARRLIEASADVGNRRGEIIEVCEAIAQRSYLDQEVEVEVHLHSQIATESLIKLSYFINDHRFSWKPTITVDIDGDNVNIRGMIAIENQSSQSFEDVEVSFADFSHEFSDNASNYRGDPKQRMKKMKKQVMKNMMFR